MINRISEIICIISTYQDLILLSVERMILIGLFSSYTYRLGKKGIGKIFIGDKLYSTYLGKDMYRFSKIGC